MKPKVLVITGPTASGKTDISIKIAEEISSKTGKNVEIISADSRQVYKQIPIATAQPGKEQLKKFKHHFINELPLKAEFNAGEFGKKGRTRIDKILKKGNIPVIVGGSGLYISSLVYGLFDYDEFHDEKELKQKQKRVRADLYDRLEKNGLDKLVSELKKADPQTAMSIPNATPRRVIRALEVYYLTGVPISDMKKKKIEISFEPVQFGVNLERIELYERINKRAELMIEKGLIEEIKKLKAKGYHYKNYNSLNTVGVKEVFDYLDDLISYDRMLELIKQNTRRFAKRQLTWFRRDKNLKWHSPEDAARYKIPF
jgi:tRNA dimethylallyltransferase